MRYFGNQLVFSPSDLCNYAESQFASWMDRSEREEPGRFSKDPSDEMQTILQSKGKKHEESILEKFQKQGKSIIDLRSGSTEDTIQAMKQGADVIYQAPLGHEHFAGIADFLMKVSGSSILGDYYYEVWDSKLSRTAKPNALIQLCAYVNMLQPLQGRIPERIGVILGNGIEETFRTYDYYFYYMALKKRFLEFQNKFSTNDIPDPVLSYSFGRWSTAAYMILSEKDSVFQVAGITRKQTKRLTAAGIDTMTELGQQKSGNVKGIAPDVLQRLIKQSELQVRSRDKIIPDFELASGGEDALSKLPPHDPTDIFFDMEGFPLTLNGLEYLWGYVLLDDAKPRFECIWAHDAAAERQALMQFVELVHARWLKHPQMHVYHYASYETRALAQLAQRYVCCEGKVDDLLRNGVFVDLYQIVRTSFIIGSDSYSIKSVEHLYRTKRMTDVANAATSVVFYQNWLEASMQELPTAADILEDIRKYNEDDCQSTHELTVWLRQQMTDLNISSQRREEAKPSQPVDSEFMLLCEKLEKTGEVGILLSQLMSYHQREIRCEWWNYFARLEMNSEELYDDPDCIAGLVHDGRTPEKTARSLIYTYSFDPTQDVKAQVEDTLCLRQDSDISITIYELNIDKGLIRLKTGSKNRLPEVLDLVPKGPRPHEFEKIVREYGKAYSEGDRHQALDDFLNRRSPRLKDGIFLPRNEMETTVDAIIVAICGMDGTSLVIQGPPGAGKTFTGSKAIAELCLRGKRVGIMSNSHKAIDNILIEAVRWLKDDRGGKRVVKIGQPVTGLEIELVPSGSSLTNLDSIALVGGTVWAFTKEHLKDQFDYLFIDEASQVCVANLVVASRSARNFVFLGDQMQLAQPAKGSHPGDSGLSCLDFYLKGQPTIPLDRGIFLPVTRRLHPDICWFISEMVYEGRLDHHASTIDRILLPKGGETFITSASGIQFIPVTHYGNQQSSVEEAYAIEKIIAELLSTDFATGGHSNRRLTKSDILIVAPFNMQVRQLQNTLGPDFRIASIDKFQGQEAPVVILSLGASSADDAPRGIEFIFDKNRLNVALSRAQSLAIVVGSPALTLCRVRNLDQMRLVNFYCRIVLNQDVPLPRGSRAA